MRPLLLLLFIASLAVGDQVATAGEPYSAFISQDGTVVRSGPGEGFYATERLGRTTKVEVYAEEQGGWLAIRPPAGSFSWIAADDLQATPDPSLAKAAFDGVSAWIGSTSQRVVEHRAQVQLEQGELVEVLGQRQFCPPGGTCQRWFKIAPPAGEFRYVHSETVSREPILESTDDPGQVPIDVAGFGQRRSTAVARAGLEQPAAPEHQTATPAPDTSGAIRIPEAALTGLTEPAGPSTENTSGELDSAFLAEIDRIDLQLSQMVASDVKDWDLPKLAASAQALVDSGQSAPQRGRARLLLERIEEFQEWQRRFRDNTAKVREAVDGASDAIAELAASDPIGSGIESVGHQTSELPKFDGTGLLMPVHSDKRGAPPYALLDEAGNVLQYVSPAAGFNLHRYIEKEVGIMGKRGFSGEMKKPHLMAYRVVELDRHR